MLVDQITSSFERVYIGKAGHCCCGCAGDYFDDDASKQLVIGKILASQNVEDLDVCINTTIGKKLYIAYRTDESMRKMGILPQNDSVAC